MPAARTIKNLTRAVLLAALLTSGTPSQAATIGFTDRAAFNLAAQPNVFENFDGPLQPCTFLPPGSDCQLTYVGVTFDFDIASPPYNPTAPPASLQSVRIGPTFVVQTQFEPMTAIGFDVDFTPVGGTGAFSSFRAFPTVLLPDGSVAFGPGFGLNEPGFLGLVATEGAFFTGLLLAPPLASSSGGDPLVRLDNLALQVPEPTTLLLLALGGGALIGSRRCRVAAKGRDRSG